MALQNFDKLNNMSTIWFDKMEISDTEKKRRVDLSLDYCEIIIMLFMLIEGNHPKESCVDFVEERLKIIAENYIGKDDLALVNDWSRKEAEKVVDITLRHKDDEPEYKLVRTDEGGTERVPKTFDMPELEIEIPMDEYWTSEERGLLIGIECASNTANFEELDKAMDSGKTRKVWLTEADDRVRKTHEEVHGHDIPITDYFLVGNSYLLFPGDLSRDPEDSEVVNCRCHLEYY